MLLMTRLQTKVKDLERDRSHLQREVERRSQHGSRSTPDEDAEKEISDAIKVFVDVLYLFFVLDIVEQFKLILAMLKINSIFLLLLCGVLMNRFKN